MVDTSIASDIEFSE
ncbi:hypothetical protein [Jejubacter sp. L23]